MKCTICCIMMAVLNINTDMGLGMGGKLFACKVLVEGNGQNIPFK